MNSFKKKAGIFNKDNNFNNQKELISKSTKSNLNESKNSPNSSRKIFDNKKINPVNSIDLLKKQNDFLIEKINKSLNYNINKVNYLIINYFIYYI